MSEEDIVLTRQRKPSRFRPIRLTKVNSAKRSHKE